MKAAQIKQYGQAEGIEINRNAPLPTVGAGQILVEVKAASLNRVDSAFIKGYMKDMMPLPMPMTIAGDFAGIVREVGTGVTNFKIGDEVYGNAGPFKGGSGSMAELVVAATTNVAMKPKTIDFVASAALPLVGASALQGIETELNIQSGQKILIQGGAGGVGSLAIQIAKLHGAYVATTVSTDDIAFVKGLGADEVIDYKAQDVSLILKNYDGVLDTAGGEALNKLFIVLKAGGKLVTLAAQPDQAQAKQYSVTASSQMTQASTVQLEKLAGLIDSGKVVVHVEKTFPFEQAKDAFLYFEIQHPKGKVVVEI